MNPTANSDISADADISLEMFGLCVRAARKQKDISQERLAGLTGLDTSTVQRIESGRDCSLSTAIRIARALEVPLDGMVAVRDHKRFGVERQKALLFRALEMMLRVGVTITEAVSLASETIEHDGLREACASILVDIKAGCRLDEALAKHPSFFTRMDIAYAKIGEENAGMCRSFAGLAEHYASGASPLHAV